MTDNASVPSAEEIESRIKNEVRTFLKTHSEEITAADQILIDRAKLLIQGRYLHGFHQLVAVGVDENGKEYVGIQLDNPHGNNSDAEIGLIHDAAKTGAKLVTAVVVHQKRPDEGSEVHVANSCGDCLEALLHHHPNLRLICWVKDELLKIHVRYLVLLPFKKRRAGANGISEHQHHT